MKKSHIISALLFLVSCSKGEMLVESTETVSEEKSVFYIDKTLHPDLYQDSNGYYHIFSSGNFTPGQYNSIHSSFQIKGNLNGVIDVNEDINGVPTTETRFDSDYWIVYDPGNWLTFNVKSFEPFSFFYDDCYLELIETKRGVTKFCDLDTNYGWDIYNVTGYEYNDNVCGVCPWRDIIMGNSIKNTYTPVQDFTLYNNMIGDTLKIFIKMDFKYDIYTEGLKPLADYEFNIIVEGK